MNIILLCVGKLKENYLKEACKEYEKRLSAFCRITVEEIEAERLSENPSEADRRLSMSEMTFPHQLARVMLMEQIYRAYTIINNRRYHK